ncbi:ribosome maturation factor RimP [Gordonia sp. HY442]|uniref:ribosome maturation factor RimP n=1 Tax=Gordonia zhenghanii TaxID=2911516 RepID=UPI001EFFFDF8|nr:ribosome maturation factor RimP [Gordonia zhenghanii]MCF8602765.1 ribosome maturation factor RimP [Gordonia zhenghanii]
MSGVKTEAIGHVVEPVLAAAGYDLEEIVVLTPPGRRDIRVVVDRDGGAHLDALADLSRELDAALEATDLMGEQAYDLEVTTPGIGRPLTLPRHWRRNQGRSAKVEYTLDEKPTSVVARIGRLDGATVTLVKADKGRLQNIELHLDDVQKAVVEVDFRRPGEAELRACGLDDAEIARRRAPADTDSADTDSDN